MKIKKLAAGALTAVTVGATFGAVAFGQVGIGSYVTHSGGTLTSPMVVIGSSAGDATNYPKDVVAAADLAAHIAGYATTPVTATGSSKSFTITAEGREVATANTKIYLDDSMGKSGVRTTMTGEDLPTLLATGSVTDKNSTVIKYDQYLFLTPSSTGSASYSLQFERPSSSSSDDGTYSFGRLPTSPGAGDYFVKYRLNFRKGAQAAALVGKVLTIAGEKYTVLADSASESGTPTLVATKASAAQSVLVSDGEVSVTVGAATYKVKVIGTSDADTVVVQVNGVSSSATKSRTTSIGGVDVYVDDVFHFANNQEASGANLLIGAEKYTFTNSSKIKHGSNDDNIEGTFVTLTTSSGKYDTLDVYFGAPESSVTDNLREGSWYKLPGFSNLALFFPGMSEDPMGSSRSVLKVAPSGDNLLQAEWTDNSQNKLTFTYAYKATSAGTVFKLADSNGNNIVVNENAAVAQDQYVVLDAGDFPHLMQVSSLSSDALSFTLKDVFSGESTKYDLAVSDNGQKTIYIDGQSYNVKYNAANTTVAFTWGPGSGFAAVGDGYTVWPTLKGKNDERLALINTTATINASAMAGKKLQLPTGAVTITFQNVGGADWPSAKNLTLTAVTDEDGETSACTTTPCVSAFNLSSASGTQSTTFTLGKTATGGVVYQINDSVISNETFVISVRGSSSETSPLSQPALLLFEEKDDSGDRYAVVIPTAYTSDSGNALVDAGIPIFTASEDSQTRGTDSNIFDYVDLYGTYVTRSTSDQNTVSLYYPDEQVYAILGAGSSAGTASIGGSSGSTVNAAVVITSPVAKLANEINTATLTSDLVLVGGPCANTLVAQLAADTASGIPACDAWTLSKGLIKEVTNAFGSGKKALVVAGTTADDTRWLASQVMQGTLSWQQ